MIVLKQKHYSEGSKKTSRVFSGRIMCIKGIISMVDS